MANETPLNIFKTKAFELTTIEQTLYTSTVGFTGIILGAQVSNISSDPATITFILRKNNVDYVMLNQFTVPPNDAAEATTGKLVVEEGATVKAYASHDSRLNIVLSLLETSNE